jgi:hypothetical protein
MIISVTAANLKPHIFEAGFALSYVANVAMHFHDLE